MVRCHSLNGDSLCTWWHIYYNIIQQIYIYIISHSETPVRAYKKNSLLRYLTLPGVICGRTLHICFYTNANAYSSLLLGERMNICHGVTFVPSVFSFVPWKRIDYYVKLCLQKHQRPHLILQLSPGKCDSNSYFSWAVSRHAILKPGVEWKTLRCNRISGAIFSGVWIACSSERTGWYSSLCSGLLYWRQAVSLWSARQIK